MVSSRQGLARRQALFTAASSVATLPLAAISCKTAVVLLYPAAVHHVSETVNVQGFQVRWETVDLSRQWETIEGKLVEIIEST